MIDIVCARTGRLWDIVIEKAKKAKKDGEKFVVLVPEMYTLQAEKDLIADLKQRGLLFVEIFSPSRLGERVFQFAGSSVKEHIDAFGKQLIIERILEEAEKELFVFSSGGGLGALSAIAKLIGELKQLAISPDDLEARLHIYEDEFSKRKLKDIIKIYRAYMDNLSKGYLDEEDARQDMLSRLHESGLVRDAIVVCYGFDDIVPSLSELLIAISKSAKETTLTIVADKKPAPDAPRFASIIKSMQRLRKKAEESGVSTNFSFLEKELIGYAEEIRHLEKNLISYKTEKYPNKAQGLHIFAAPKLYDEVEHCLSVVVSKMDEGILPSEISILCSDIEKYAALFSARCAVYGIPSFVSKKYPLRSFSAVRGINALFNCITYHFRNEDVFAYLESGFSPLSEEEVWEIRTYAEEYGVKKDRWIKPFVRGEEARVLLNEEKRRRFVEPILQLKEGLIAAKNAGESIEALLLFLEKGEVRAKVEALSGLYLQKGMITEMYLARQLWEEILALLKQISLVLGSETLSVEKLSRWLQATLENKEIASIPSLTSSLEIGELGSVLPSRPKVLFILGMDDGAFQYKDDSILTELEMDKLADSLDAPLGQIQKEFPKLKLLSFWKAAASPLKELYLSYQMVDEQGEDVHPNPILKTIQDIFPNVETEGGALYDVSREGPITPLQTLEIAGPMLREGRLHGRWKAAFEKIQTMPHYHHICQSMQRMLKNDPSKQSISKANAIEAFDTRSISASRIRSYAECPFKYFVDYGLKPKIHKKWGVEVNEMGTFYHSMMERFAKDISERKNIAQLGKEDVFYIIEDLAKEHKKDWEKTPFGDTKRAQAASKKMIRICQKTAWAVTKGYQNSAFSLQGTEIKFGKKDGLPPIIIKLKGGKEIFLDGIIDRVDIYHKEGKQYFRIIDYKSGDVSLTPADIMNGIKLQLFIYLKAILQASPALIPAGLFYQHFDDPMLNLDALDEKDEGKEEAEILKKLRLNGIAINDVDIVTEMDQAGISLKPFFTKEGKQRKDVLLLDESEFQLLADFALSKSAGFAEEILSGKVDAFPLKKDNDKSLPCSYCDYPSVCRRNRQETEGVKKREKCSLEDIVAWQKENKGL